MSLAAAGHEVHIVAPEAGETTRGGVRFHPLPVRPARSAVFRAAERMADAWRAIRSLAPDVVHFHDPVLILTGLALRLAGTRVVFDVHEDHPREARAMFPDRPFRAALQSSTFRLLEFLSRRLLNRFVCATPEIAAKFPPGRTILVRNFARLDLQEAAFAATPPIPYADRPLAAIYAGGITEARGASEMVASLTHVEIARLELFGRFDNPKLEQRLRQSPAWDRVTHHGFRPHAEVLAALGSVRLGLLVLHPHRIFREALPVKLFEYMAAGLPVVVSDFPNWRRIVEGAGCGVLVDPVDPAAVAEGIRQLLTRPNEAAAMGERGRVHALKHYSWGAEAEQLLALYKDPTWTIQASVPDPE